MSDARGLGLEAWERSGILAPADGHLARALVRLAGDTRPELAWLTALLSRHVRHGHVCLDLATLGPRSFVDEEGRVPPDLTWPAPEDLLALAAASPLVDVMTSPRALIGTHEASPGAVVAPFAGDAPAGADVSAERVPGGPSPASEEPSAGRGDAPGRHEDPAAPEAFDGALSVSKARYAGPGGDHPHHEERPLCLVGTRLYLRRYLEHEEHLAHALEARAVAEPEPWAGAAEALARLFKDDDGGQRGAAERALERRLVVVTGGPGTGKTTTVARLLALFVERARALGGSPPRIVLLAPTGKAAARLGEAIAGVLGGLPVTDDVRAAIPVSAMTIHRRLEPDRERPTRFRYNATHPLPADVVVVDEASMMDVPLARRLLDAVPARARLVLLGDPDQLASVEVGSLLGDLCGPLLEVPAPATLSLPEPARTSRSAPAPSSGAAPAIGSGSAPAPGAGAGTVQVGSPAASPSDPAPSPSDPALPAGSFPTPPASGSAPFDRTTEPTSTGAPVVAGPDASGGAHADGAHPRGPETPTDKRDAAGRAKGRRGRRAAPTTQLALDFGGGPADEAPGSTLPRDREAAPGTTLPAEREAPGTTLPRERDGEPGPKLPREREGGPGPTLPREREGGPGTTLPRERDGEPGPTLPREREGGPGPTLPRERDGEPGPTLPREREGGPGPTLPRERDGEPGPTLPRDREGTQSVSAEPGGAHGSAAWWTETGPAGGGDAHVDVTLPRERDATTSKPGAEPREAIAGSPPDGFLGERRPPIAESIVRLHRSHRFGAESGIGELARAIRGGDVQAVLDVLERRPGDVTWLEPSTGVEALAEVVRAGFRPALAGGDPAERLARLERFRILCAHRRGHLGVEGLNATTERWLAAELDRDGAPIHYPGRPILVTRNDYPQQLLNGDLGLVVRDPERPERTLAVFRAADGGPRFLSTARLPHVETAFAMSIHKSQGSEFDAVVVVLPEHRSPILSRELLYTAVTRARQRVVLFASRDVIADAVAHRIERASGLAERLWRPPA